MVFVKEQTQTKGDKTYTYYYLYHSYRAGDGDPKHLYLGKADDSINDLMNKFDEEAKDHNLGVTDAERTRLKNTLEEIDENSNTVEEKIELLREANEDDDKPDFFITGYSDDVTTVYWDIDYSGENLEFGGQLSQDFSLEDRMVVFNDGEFVVQASFTDKWEFDIIENSDDFDLEIQTEDYKVEDGKVINQRGDDQLGVGYGPVDSVELVHDYIYEMSESDKKELEEDIFEIVQDKGSESSPARIKMVQSVADYENKYVWRALDWLTDKDRIVETGNGYYVPGEGSSSNKLPEEIGEWNLEIESGERRVYGAENDDKLFVSWHTSGSWMTVDFNQFNMSKTGYPKQDGVYKIDSSVEREEFVQFLENNRPADVVGEFGDRVVMDSDWMEKYSEINDWELFTGDADSPGVSWESDGLVVQLNRNKDGLVIVDNIEGDVMDSNDTLKIAQGKDDEWMYEFLSEHDADEIVDNFDSISELTRDEEDFTSDISEVQVINQDDEMREFGENILDLVEKHDLLNDDWKVAKEIEVEKKEKSKKYAHVSKSKDKIVGMAYYKSLDETDKAKMDATKMHEALHFKQSRHSREFYEELADLLDKEFGLDSEGMKKAFASDLRSRDFEPKNFMDIDKDYFSSVEKFGELYQNYFSLMYIDVRPESWDLDQFSGSLTIDNPSGQAYELKLGRGRGKRKLVVAEFNSISGEVDVKEPEYVAEIVDFDGIDFELEVQEYDTIEELNEAMEDSIETIEEFDQDSSVESSDSWELMGDESGYKVWTKGSEKVVAEIQRGSSDKGQEYRVHWAIRHYEEGSGEPELERAYSTDDAIDEVADIIGTITESGDDVTFGDNKRPVDVVVEADWMKEKHHNSLSGEVEFREGWDTEEYGYNNTEFVAEEDTLEKEDIDENPIKVQIMRQKGGYWIVKGFNTYYVEKKGYVDIPDTKFERRANALQSAYDLMADLEGSFKELREDAEKGKDSKEDMTLEEKKEFLERALENEYMREYIERYADDNIDVDDLDSTPDVKIENLFADNPMNIQNDGKVLQVSDDAMVMIMAFSPSGISKSDLSLDYSDSFSPKVIYPRPDSETFVAVENDDIQDYNPEDGSEVKPRSSMFSEEYLEGMRQIYDNGFKLHAKQDFPGLFMPKGSNKTVVIIAPRIEE